MLEFLNGVTYKSGGKRKAGYSLKQTSHDARRVAILREMPTLHGNFLHKFLCKAHLARNEDIERVLFSSCKAMQVAILLVLLAFSYEILHVIHLASCDPCIREQPSVEKTVLEPGHFFRLPSHEYYVPVRCMLAPRFATQTKLSRVIETLRTRIDRFRKAVANHWLAQLRKMCGPAANRNLGSSRLQRRCGLFDQAKPFRLLATRGKPKTLVDSASVRGRFFSCRSRPCAAPILGITEYLRSRGGVVVRLLASRLDKSGSIPCGDAPGFSHVEIVLDDAAGRRVFSGISRFPRCCIPVPLYTHLASLPSSALKTSMFGATQISSLTSVTSAPSPKKFPHHFRSPSGKLDRTVVERASRLASPRCQHHASLSPCYRLSQERSHVLSPLMFPSFPGYKTLGWRSHQTTCGGRGYSPHDKQEWSAFPPQDIHSPNQWIR
ncbi:hypothetical protein PR048_015179 [Dryococelus australis]|uniref:Uncharacterized protein n=1 Tax=Dryococelus australis TaxID=614101 RepID=A0ABQ9HG93_9NEOP|nr:hypothetical protein PR048_015179 [Dryococelus australis]